MAAGRSANQHEDESPLNGALPDVAARMGWLMRTARRLYGGTALRRIDDMARATEYPTARVQRLEAGTLRDADVVLACERALGLREGQLLAPVEVLCRTFPTVSPKERATPGPPPDPAVLSALTERLLDDGIPTRAGEWLRWARLMAVHGGISLPFSMASSLVVRLIGELSRSAGLGYVARYEALALLRCGGYGGLVIDRARAWVADPDVQAIADLVSAVGERHTPEAIAWFLELLESDRDRLVVAGALGVEASAAVTSEPDFWTSLLPELARRFDASTPQSTRWEWLSHLLRLVPAGAWRAVDVHLTRTLAPKPVVRDWSRSRTNAHWLHCRGRAEAVAARIGLPAADPMLARLLFDSAVSPRETHAVTSYMLLGGLPDLAHEVGRELAAMAESEEDGVLRARILRRLPGMLPGTVLPQVDRWIAPGGEEDLRSAGLRIAGSAGHPVPTEVLAAETSQPGFPAAAIYCAGMTGHPVLADWLSHERPDVRGAARWWLRRGSRVVD
ncbi:hypothetical protein [uncultured Nocardioides sp.]|uniref:hypothetical protein n=1 Tax=uncultured Nocardioides sp. TaxID=198441 RepID=UPI002616E163|nr:hypothetical protein [uncultured Nocardioides sp.]